MLSWIEIDRAHLESNIEAFRKIIAPSTKLMVVVKANAYGHGIETVAPLLAEHVDWLGVNCAEEALTLTRLGMEKPIAILGHSTPDQIDEIVHHGYRQVLYRMDVANALSASAVKFGTTARVHLKIETGTNRQGISLSALESFVRTVKQLPGIEIEGVYTHFANIEDTLDPSFALSQVEKFFTARATLKRLGIDPSQVHASATSGALLYPDMDFTMVRVGIGAYGIWPSRESQIAARERGRQIALTPVLTWKTRVAQVKDIQSGDYIGYGLTYQARRAMQVAVLPIGYYDGYDRKLSNSGRVLIRGQHVPVIGRVAMNMTMVDVTDVGAEPDDEVVLLGRQRGAEIRAEELAEKIGTIPYEVVSRINPLLPRIA
jgi:alanine racemase